MLHVFQAARFINTETRTDSIRQNPQVITNKRRLIDLEGGKREALFAVKFLARTEGAAVDFFRGHTNQNPRILAAVPDEVFVFVDGRNRNRQHHTDVAALLPRSRIHPHTGFSAFQSRHNRFLAAVGKSPLPELGLLAGN